MVAASDQERFLLLLLADSNLPTGGFIASSGYESYVQHGLLVAPDTAGKAAGVLQFIEKSLDSYARLNLPFFSAAHDALSSLKQESSSPASLQQALHRIKQVDRSFESMVLNHVARRASTAQGVALLTLYERSFSDPEDTADAAKALVEQLRAGIKTGEISGHLPVGFGVITGALGLSLASAQHLFLFTHARSLLSSAIRMNTIGPYVSHRMLLHDVQPLVTAAHERCKDATLESGADAGPATTWPLGEILAARHDQLHSKIFNS